MNMEIKIPQLPPNYADDDGQLVICDFYIKDSQYVYKDQNLFDVETSNVVLEVVAPVSGTVHSINIQIGQKVETDMVVMKVDPSTKEPIFKKVYRIINMEFLSGLMLGSIITYAILKMI
jgi:pyruvate/2-oxoglutarate dehydrogenase complex dihydrolipoamide acyltransferase (E2) component